MPTPPNKKKQAAAKSHAHTKKDLPLAEAHDEQQSLRFRQTLQWLLEDRNLSETELSRLTHLSPATIHRLIYGITDPRLTTLRAIAEFFKIRIEQLIGEYPIPSVTQTSNNSSDKILFATPMLIPFIEWEQLHAHAPRMNELTMSNWANWHATTNEIQDNDSSDLFATKLNYTAGTLLHAESVLIIKATQDQDKEPPKIGDCVIGSNEKGTTFIGQIGGSGDDIAIKGGNLITVHKCKLYGTVIKSEIPFSKIARYTVFI